MFTLTRAFAALSLALFALWIAPTYEAIYDPERPMPALRPLLAVVGFFTGWWFLGAPRRQLWFSVYLGLQAVVLTGVIAAGLGAVREIFVQGYRRRYDEATEAVLAIPEFAWDYLSRAWVPDFVLTLAVGGVALGVAVHLVDWLLDRRRLAR